MNVKSQKQNIIIEFIKTKRLQFIEKVIMDNKYININKHFNGKIVMSILINNIVDNENYLICYLRKVVIYILIML